MAALPLQATPCSLRAAFTPRAPASGLLRRARRLAARPLFPPPPQSSSSAAVPTPDSSNNGASVPEAPSSNGNGAGSLPADAAAAPAAGIGLWGWVKQQQEKSAALRAKLATLGLAAVLAYGIMDGVSYTIAFSIAFLGFEAQTGLNPTQNVGDLVKICILMWAGNNVSRPFRLAGAAALAPAMDKLMDRLQAKLKLKTKGAAFALLVAAVASVCLSILGALFFSRWIRG